MALAARHVAKRSDAAREAFPVTSVWNLFGLDLIWEEGEHRLARRRVPRCGQRGMGSLARLNRCPVGRAEARTSEWKQKETPCTK